MALDTRYNNSTPNEIQHQTSHERGALQQRNNKIPTEHKASIRAKTKTAVLYVCIIQQCTNPKKKHETKKNTKTRNTKTQKLKKTRSIHIIPPLEEPQLLRCCVLRVSRRGGGCIGLHVSLPSENPVEGGAHVPRHVRHAKGGRIHFLSI